MSRKVAALCLCLLTGFAHSANACRLWVAVGENFNKEDLMNQLVSDVQSLKNLGTEYKDGWSLAYYDTDDAFVVRSDKPSVSDPLFELTADHFTNAQHRIMLGHLRRSSSGCLEGVDNPHPFERVMNGKHWLFGHNGGIDKQILMGLIGEKYLLHNEPKTCTYDAPDSWVDSELFFIFLMKKIEEHNWDVLRGIEATLTDLYSHIDDKNRYLNFFLSDGQVVWVFKKGNPLYYQYSEKNKTAVVASSVSQGFLGDWSPIPENVIVSLEQNEHPHFYPFDYEENNETN